VIFGAMNAISSQTCVTFTLHSDQQDFLLIEKLPYHSNCVSSFGYFSGQRTISLGRTVEQSCVEHATILHHLMRILGFPYEHTRPDRDRYLTVDLNNVKRQSWFMFKKLEKDQFIYDVEMELFDHSSIMFPNTTPISVVTEKSILSSRNPGENINSKKTGLSNGDIKKIQNAYSCSSKNLKSEYTSFSVDSGNATQLFNLHLMLISLIFLAQVI